VAPDDKALVVFARPKKTPVINFYVFDENKMSCVVEPV
jgi:hypothetical protein